MTTLRVHGREATLLNLLDRLLDKGLVVAGDVTISVADVDLISASLRLAVTSVDKMWEMRTGVPRNGGPSGPSWVDEGNGGLEPGPSRPHPNLPPPEERGPKYPGSTEGNSIRSLGVQAVKPPARESGVSSQTPSLLLSRSAEERDRGVEGFDPDKATTNLAQLVLTIGELLRQLLEREALRRMERGTLTSWEMERLGQAFLRMEQQMQELKEYFHLQDQDLNLDLGPLGKLM